MATRIYLDHAATTPMLPQAREAVADALARWANPSSPHAEGRAARAMLEDARRRILERLGVPDRALIFTSGASEAIAIALARGKGGKRLASAAEHDALLRHVPDRLPVDALGRIRLSETKGALLALQTVNNETGVLQPMAEAAKAMRTSGGLILADAAQSAAKLPLPDADMIALSAHKLGGPPGIGALILSSEAVLAPEGGQERGLRAGTENLPGAMGFAAALDAYPDWLDRAATLRARLDEAIIAAGGEVVAHEAERLPTIGALRMSGVPASTQVMHFDLAGIAVGAGSACSSGSIKPSHVLTAMGWSENQAREVVRVSFGPATTADDIGRFVDAWETLARRSRRHVA